MGTQRWQYYKDHVSVLHEFSTSLCCLFLTYYLPTTVNCRLDPLADKKLLAQFTMFLQLCITLLT